MPPQGPGIPMVGTIRCPVVQTRHGIPVRCPTFLQRTPNGSLRDGLEIHLVTVHGLTLEAARLEAAQAVKVGR